MLQFVVRTTCKNESSSSWPGKLINYPILVVCKLFLMHPSKCVNIVSENRGRDGMKSMFFLFILLLKLRVDEISVPSLRSMEKAAQDL